MFTNDSYIYCCAVERLLSAWWTLHCHQTLCSTLTQHLIPTFSHSPAMAERVQNERKKDEQTERRGEREDAAKDVEKQTPRRQRDRYRWNRRRERKPDKTLADKQKEQAGALATFGLRSTPKPEPITVFVLDGASPYFPKNLLAIKRF